MASWEIHESPVKVLKGTSSANEVTLPATSPRHLPVLWPQHLGMTGLFIGIRMALVSFSCIYSGGHVTLFFTCFKRCFSWCWTFQEKVKSVASRACCKFQEKAKSVASRAYLELQDTTSELSIPNVASKEPGARTLLALPTPPPEPPPQSPHLPPPSRPNKNMVTRWQCCEMCTTFLKRAQHLAKCITSLKLASVTCVRN